MNPANEQRGGADGKGFMALALELLCSLPVAKLDK